MSIAGSAARATVRMGTMGGQFLSARRGLGAWDAVTRAGCAVPVGPFPGCSVAMSWRLRVKGEGMEGADWVCRRAIERTVGRCGKARQVAMGCLWEGGGASRLERRAEVKS